MIDKTPISFSGGVLSSPIFTFFFVFGFLMVRQRDESRLVTNRCRVSKVKRGDEQTKEFRFRHGSLQRMKRGDEQTKEIGEK